MACTECQISKTRCENPLSGLKDKCRRCLRLNKECIVCPSVRLPSVKDSAKQCNSLPTTGDLLLSHGISSYHPQEHGKEGFVNASSDLETEISASFSEGLIKANQRQRQSAEYIDLFFFFLDTTDQPRQFQSHYQTPREYKLTLKLTLFSL